MGPSSGTVCTALQQLTTAQGRREGPRCCAAMTLLWQPFACSLPGLLPPCSGMPGSAMAPVLYWPCLGTDNLSRSGGSGQLKTTNGQNEGCSATQWLNTFSSYLRPTGLPGLGHLCRRVRQNGCQGMPIFPELPCSWSD